MQCRCWACQTRAARCEERGAPAGAAPTAATAAGSGPCQCAAKGSGWAMKCATRLERETGRSAMLFACTNPWQRAVSMAPPWHRQDSGHSEYNPTRFTERGRPHLPGVVRRPPMPTHFPGCRCFCCRRCRSPRTPCTRTCPPLVLPRVLASPGPRCIPAPRPSPTATRSLPCQACFCPCPPTRPHNHHTTTTTTTSPHTTTTTTRTPHARRWSTSWTRCGLWSGRCSSGWRMRGSRWVMAATAAVTRCLLHNARQRWPFIWSRPCLLCSQRTPAPHPPPASSAQNVCADIVVLTRLIPDAHGTSCNERLEPISGCQNARILRVPFRDREG